MYTPDENFNGTDSFTYHAFDGGVDGDPALGISESSMVMVTINSIPDVPVAYNNTISLDEDTEFSGILTALDVDGDDLTYQIDNTPNNTM